MVEWTKMCADAIKELDANGDGRIDYPEFCALLRTLKKSPKTLQTKPAKTS